uniref:RxLR effector candidate protein n=1 Tax=Hyaloperonospora arabidopsidis (strain Emoy2) TaxID=559515 RepID=M4BXH2_HYAAE|nr:RxLR effector candidate protein [Hyaloperonospora arabidopsidis Emoy2]
MRHLGVLLLYELAVLARLLTKADDVAVTEAVTSTKMIGDTASSTATHSNVAIGRFRRLDETEERALPVPSSVIQQSVPPTGMALIGSWYKSLGPTIKSSFASFADYKPGPSMVGHFFGALLPKLKNSIDAHVWLHNGETADSIFKKLRLDAGLDKVAYSPRFYTWVEFVKLLIEHKGAEKWSIARVVSETYSDVELARTIDAAKTREDRRLAKYLKAGQTSYWLHPKKTGPEVYTLLGLQDKKGKENIFNLPEFYRWYEYVTKEYQGDSAVRVVEVLAEHYSMRELGHLFNTAKPRGKLKKEYCVKVETAVGKKLKFVLLTMARKKEAMKKKAEERKKKAEEGKRK